MNIRIYSSHSVLHFTHKYLTPAVRDNCKPVSKCSFTLAGNKMGCAMTVLIFPLQHRQEAVSCHSIKVLVHISQELVTTVCLVSDWHNLLCLHLSTQSHPGVVNNVFLHYQYHPLICPSCQVVLSALML